MCKLTYTSLFHKGFKRIKICESYEILRYCDKSQDKQMLNAKQQLTWYIFKGMWNELKRWREGAEEWEWEDVGGRKDRQCNSGSMTAMGVLHGVLAHFWAHVANNLVRVSQANWVNGLLNWVFCKIQMFTFLWSGQE